MKEKIFIVLPKGIAISEALKERLKDKGITDVTIIEEDISKDTSPEKIADGIVAELRSSSPYSEEEEEKIRKRLEDLGYL